MANFVKSIFHNIGVVVVGFVFAFLCAYVDAYFGTSVYSSYAIAFGGVLVALGFALRVWATYHFYQNQMRVIALHAQQTLITSGPYAFTRNPLYLGGNAFIFFGASLVLGSAVGLILTAAHLPFINWFIQREEKQLAASFGDAWTEYARRVRRWI
jgi:protein-S-isoprenylcysteine O-methyltransferase Ste14